MVYFFVETKQIERKRGKTALFHVFFRWNKAWYWQKCSSCNWKSGLQEIHAYNHSCSQSIGVHMGQHMTANLLVMGDTGPLNILVFLVRSPTHRCISHSDFFSLSHTHTISLSLLNVIFFFIMKPTMRPSLLSLTYTYTVSVLNMMFSFVICQTSRSSPVSLLHTLSHTDTHFPSLFYMIFCLVVSPTSRPFPVSLSYTHSLEYDFHFGY